MRWAEEWAKEGKKLDWQRFMAPRGYVALPRRWVVERTYSWLSQNRRMSLGTTRGLCDRRGVRVCCHDSPHDEATRPGLRTFHTAS
jgi:transposase